MDTIFTHIVRYVQEIVGSAKVRAELQQTETQTDKTMQAISGLTKSSHVVGHSFAGLTTQLENTAVKVGTFAGAAKILNRTFIDGSGATIKARTAYDAMGRVIGETTTTINKASSGVGDLEKALRRAAIVAPIWLLLRAGMMAVLQTIKDQVKFLIELETAMARIQIVGKGTAEEYNNLKDSLIALSKAYGVSATDAITAAQTFAQQGKTVSETLQLTQQAMLASQVLGQDVKTTVDDMTAAMNGFNISANESTSIIDKWINVERNFAVTSKDLAEATKVAGATANQFGVSISEFLGDVTAIIEVTRKSGSEAARGLSFVYARLYTTAQQTINKIAQVKFYLDEEGKATNALTGALRPVSDILGELAGKWETLTLKEKVAIDISLGSKRQLVVVNALMQNYNRSIDARIAAMTAAGTAEKAFNIIQETTAFKLKQVSSGWNNLTNALSDTEGFKFVIYGFGNLINNITYLIDKEKGYRSTIASTITQQKLEIESTISTASGFKEVIALRDKLLQAPQSNETINRLKILNDYIESISAKEPTIKLALETGDTVKIDAALDEVQKAALKRKIVLDVQLKYLPKIEEAQSLADSFSSQLSGSKPLLEEKVLDLYKEQAKEVEEQYKTALADYEIKKGLVDVEEENLDVRIELNDKEKEALDIAHKLAIFTIQNKDNKQAQIAYEIELTKNAKFQEDSYERTLQIQKLQNSLAEEQLSFKEKEKQYLIDSFIQNAKIRGISDGMLTMAEATLTKQLFGENALRNNLSLRLKLEERLTREKLNQVEIGNDTLKLYDIAEAEGKDVAMQLGSFLTGGIGLKQLSEMPKILEAFKKYFPEKMKEFQAAQFFGIPFRGFGGAGERQYAPGWNVPIPEFPGTKMLAREVNEIKDANISAPVTVSGINININTDLAGKTKNEVILNLKNKIIDVIKNDPEADKIFHDKIELF